MTSQLKFNQIEVYEIENILRHFFANLRPPESNGFLIRFGDKINNFNRRRSYIVNYPINDISDNLTDHPLINMLIDVNDITDKFISYVVENVLNFDLNAKITIVSINAIKVNKKFNQTQIIFSGSDLNLEDLILEISTDIIQNMSLRLTEYYMDVNYPDIDITDPEDKEKFDLIFDNLDIDDIFESYPIVDVYVPLTLKVNDEHINIYLNGTISTNSKIVDIIDSIRLSLDTNDINEQITYSSDEIIYKFETTNLLNDFVLITKSFIN